MHAETTQDARPAVAPTDPTGRNEQVHALFELARDMLCVASLDGTVTLLNPAWERVTGHSTETLLATPFIDFIHPEDCDDFREHFIGLRDGTPVERLAVRFRCADQTYRWLRFSANPGAGFVYAIARDITAKHEADQRVEQYQIALRRNAAMIDASLMQATELLRQLHELHRIVVLSLSGAARERGASNNAPHDSRSAA